MPMWHHTRDGVTTGSAPATTSWCCQDKALSLLSLVRLCSVPPPKWFHWGWSYLRSALAWQEWKRCTSSPLELLAFTCPFSLANQVASGQRGRGHMPSPSSQLVYICRPAVENHCCRVNLFQAQVCNRCPKHKRKNQNTESFPWRPKRNIIGFKLKN